MLTLFRNVHSLRMSTLIGNVQFHWNALCCLGNVHLLGMSTLVGNIYSLGMFSFFIEWSLSFQNGLLYKCPLSIRKVLSLCECLLPLGIITYLSAMFTSDVFVCSPSLGMFMLISHACIWLKCCIKMYLNFCWCPVCVVMQLLACM